MAVYKDARVTWNAIVINGVRAAAIELGAGVPDATAMGDNWAVAAAGGIKTAAVELELNGDAVSGTTTLTNWSLFGTTTYVGQEFALTLTPTTTTAGSPSNPSYSGNFVLQNSTPLQGNVGDQSIVNASFVLGSGGLTTDATT